MRGARPSAPLADGTARASPPTGPAGRPRDRRQSSRCSSFQRWRRTCCVAPGSGQPSRRPGRRRAAPVAEPITPVPPPALLGTGQARLGERLFRRCPPVPATAPGPAPRATTSSGAAPTAAPAPTGADGRPLDFNAPTVLNAALNFRLNWRGNFRTLEEQAEAVLLDPRLMGTTWAEVLGQLRADPATATPSPAPTAGDGPEPWQVLDALAAFQRSLLTPDAPLRPLAARRARRARAGGGARLRAVQGLRLRRLPPGRERRRQPLPAVRGLREPGRRRRRPTSAASPSPARSGTAASSACRACATSRSPRPTSTTAASRRSRARSGRWRGASSAGPSRRRRPTSIVRFLRTPDGRDAAAGRWRDGRRGAARHEGEPPAGCSPPPASCSR